MSAPTVQEPQSANVVTLTVRKGAQAQLVMEALWNARSVAASNMRDTDAPEVARKSYAERYALLDELMRQLV